MEVMPTCTDDKNWVGLSIRARAALAPLSPASAMVCSRTLRLAVSASSDMAKAPFNKVSTMISKKSMEPKRE